ncbi:hypothetical protein OTERR_13200 [Oryzomicrobium terrae]|uniref:B30.2/SPRY domain-containing protein n=1 Tax=Oryzomicrobium terrae TaxID=1735038 RepID=A0A5C1E788_9RHOO|nr:SPRY domain-containing protein [Oryzomicrobium terrae]QEL64796.1 hypothetical protein OTERR_13200 [Oryzomicrobium terrae]
MSGTIRTISFWVKRGALAPSGIHNLFYEGNVGASANMVNIDFINDQLRVTFDTAVTYRLVTSAYFRDPGAHMHICVGIDTTQATAANRVTLEINGVPVTSFATAAYPPQNHTFLTASGNVQYWGGYTTSIPSESYLSECRFIDGMKLPASSFGQFDAATGVWVPKAWAGTYGTNGCYLDFKDGSSLANLCLDRSGNGNNFTANSISLTAGAAYDWSSDTPSNNFCTLNPLNGLAAVSLGWGALNILASTTTGHRYGTMALPTQGKWYWELAVTSGTGGVGVGVIGDTTDGTTYSTSRMYTNDGQKYLGTTASAYAATWTTNDVISVLFDADAGTLAFWKNGTSQGTAFTGLTGTWYPLFRIAGTSIAGWINFGQRPFTYTPTTGFKALCTANLPDPAIKKPNQHFDVKLDTGANIKATAEAVFSGAAFLEWIKDRANATNWQQVDTVRGTSAVLQSNTTNAETTFSTPSGSSVAAVWKAGGAAAANTSGSTTAQVSPNTSSGFSVATYTGTGANATVGHGLGVAPKLVIVKSRTDSSNNWMVYHASLGAGNYLLLNLSAVSSAAATVWNSTAPTASVFSIGSANGSNQNGMSYVAYCFAEVDGFSRIGNYTGNGSADGTFVWCGFRPRWILIKRVTGASDWMLLDTARSPNNAAALLVYPSLANVEGDGSGAGQAVDILSNGFKLRGSNAALNGAESYIFAAFAEFPFKYANAR